MEELGESMQEEEQTMSSLEEQATRMNIERHSGTEYARWLTHILEEDRGSTNGHKVWGGSGTLLLRRLADAQGKLAGNA